MKEILDLQARVVAHAPVLAEGDGLDFSREERGGEFDLLPEELRQEIDALQGRLNAAIPEDFEYYVFLGGDEGPFFGLDFGRSPVGPGDEWNPAESILDQLRAFDWEAGRERGKEGNAMLESISILQRVTRRLPSAKGLQRDYREEVKDFVREKRRDADKLHVLYLHDADGLMEADFESGDALRDALPGMIGDGGDVFAIVAYGKPLPVERIDALNAQAQGVIQERLRQAGEQAAREGEEAAEGRIAPEPTDIEMEP